MPPSGSRVNLRLMTSKIWEWCHPEYGGENEAAVPVSEDRPAVTSAAQTSSAMVGELILDNVRASVDDRHTALISSFSHGDIEEGDVLGATSSGASYRTKRRCRCTHRRRQRQSTCVHNSGETQPGPARARVSIRIPLDLELLGLGASHVCTQRTTGDQRERIRINAAYYADRRCQLARTAQDCRLLRRT